MLKKRGTAHGNLDKLGHMCLDYLPKQDEGCLRTWNGEMKECNLERGEYCLFELTVVVETNIHQPFLHETTKRTTRGTRRSGRVVRDESHVEPVTLQCLGQGKIVRCTYKSVFRMLYGVICRDMYLCVVVDEAG